MTSCMRRSDGGVGDIWPQSGYDHHMPSENQPTEEHASSTPASGALDKVIDALDRARASAIAKTAGLPDSVGSTNDVLCGFSLYGLVRHLTEVERYWIQHVFLGQNIDFAWSDSEPDGDFQVVDGTTHSALAEAYANAGQITAEVLRGGHPDELAQQPPHGNPAPRSWIAVHLLQETARHCGHIDILRQRIDGRVGTK